MILTVSLDVGTVKLHFCQAQYEHGSCACCNSYRLHLFSILYLPLLAVTGSFDANVGGANPGINDVAASGEHLVGELSTLSC